MSAPQERLDATRAAIMEMAQSYSVAQALLTANRIGLLQELAGGSRTLPALARRLGCSRRGLRALLDALAALDLIRLRDETVSLPAAMRPLFRSGSPEDLGDVLEHQRRLYERWRKLERAVRSGRPIRAGKPRPEQRKQFLMAMIGGSRRSIRETWRWADLSGARTLLDLGGGLGSYAIGAWERWPHLEVTVFDLPEAIRLTRRHLRRGHAPLRCLAGDARTDDLGGPYDVILISNLLHMFSRAENLKILRRARRALAAEGRLLVKDFLLAPDRSGPRRAGLFGLTMLLSTPAGELYTDREFLSLFARAGLCRRSHHPIGEGSRLHVLAAR